jgi:hypothetical protein
LPASWKDKKKTLQHLTQVSSELCMQVSGKQKHQWKCCINSGGGGGGGGGDSSNKK